MILCVSREVDQFAACFSQGKFNRCLFLAICDPSTFLSNMATLSDILHQSFAGDAQSRRAAQAQLEQAAASDFGQFLLALIRELLDSSKKEETQQLAGIVVKNSLSGESEEFKRARAEQFFRVDVTVRHQVKAGLLQALVSPVAGARRAGASAISALAVLTMPKNEWPELVQSLTKIATDSEYPDEVKVSTLEAMGYICAAVDANVVEEGDVNQLLIAIIHSMNSQRADSLRFAATEALVNTLDFASSNMNAERERNKIVEMILTSCDSKDTRTRKAGFECLTGFAASYYLLLKPYMESFYSVTLRCITNDTEEVAMQAVEFWCTICDAEIVLQREMIRARQQNTQPRRLCARYIEAAAKDLVPIIQNCCLLKQDEDPASGEANIAVSGGICLG